MKVASQFQNITSTENYGVIRSYIETCTRNHINEHEALVKLMEGNPYTLAEILEKEKEYAEKSK